MYTPGDSGVPRLSSAIHSPPFVHSLRRRVPPGRRPASLGAILRGLPRGVNWPGGRSSSRSMRWAVTRRPLGGDDRDDCQPAQRMTRLEAVRAFTSWAAYGARQEADLGSLEPGKRADLVVCSEDVLECPERQIPAIAPVLTLVGGEVVFRREL